MKNRRTILVTFLILAALVMGAAYAALTDNLFIKGEATLATTSAQTNFDEDVYFTTAAVASTTGTNTATADSAVIGQTDKDSATFYVKSLGQADEKVTFSFVIKNTSTEFDAEVSLDTGYPTTTNTTLFTITYSIVNDGTVNEGPITVAAGGTATVYVTVLLKASPTENSTAAFNVNLTATSAPKAVAP